MVNPFRCSLFRLDEKCTSIKLRRNKKLLKIAYIN